MIITSKITEAIEFCCEQHNDQLRKLSKIPFASHPVSVGFILYSAGYGEDVVIAGILHDILEDTNKNQDDLKKMFGDKVTTLVKGVTEDTTIKSWRDKKDKYLKNLQVVDNEIKAISAADLLDNNRAMLRSLNNGINIWGAFTVTPEQKMSYIKERLSIIKETLNNDITNEIELTILELEKFL